jgi:signal peptidase I
LTGSTTASPRRIPAGLALLWPATCWAVLGFLVALLPLAMNGDLHRFQVMSVLSGSMTPTVDVGDLVVAEVVSPTDLAAGDLATFKSPETGKLVTHRVQSILWRGEIADVISRGDSNTVGETWSVTAESRVGKVVLRVPRAGYALGVLGTPAGQLGLAGFAGVLGVWILVVIWRPARADVAPAGPSPVASSA